MAVQYLVCNLWWWCCNCSCLVRCASGHGWSGWRYVQLLQDAHAAGPHSCTQAHGEGGPNSGDYAARYGSFAPPTHSLTHTGHSASSQVVHSLFMAAL